MRQPSQALILNQQPKTWPEHPLLTRYKREYIDFHQITPKEWRNRLRILSVFRQQLADNGRDFADMTGADLLAYAGGRLDDGRHINTVRFEMNRVRWFANWLYGIGVLSAEQILSVRGVKNPRGSTGKARPRPYSRDDLDRFYAALEAKYPTMDHRVEVASGSIHLGRYSVERWVLTGHGWPRVRRHGNRLQIEAVVALALHCALRAGEIWALDTNGVDPDLRYLVVSAKRSDPNERLREVPYTTHARDAVQAWLDFRALLNLRHKKTWLAFGPRGETQPMTRKQMYQLLPTYVGEGWELHRFRHTAATERLRAGADIEIISQWLGHANTQMTLGYLDIVKSDIARVMKRTEAAFEERVLPRTHDDQQETNDGDDTTPEVSNRAA